MSIPSYFDGGYRQGGKDGDIKYFCQSAIIEEGDQELDAERYDLV